MEFKADLCVIGAGSGGLSVASGAVQFGLNVILIEEGLMGGDCLNYGCIPSKSLLAAAKALNNSKSAENFGVMNTNTVLDFNKVHDHIKNVIKNITPHDSVERFTGMGVKVIKGHAEFISPNSISVNEDTISAKRFVISTGSKPFIPEITGINNIKYLTNETIFDLTDLPKHLIVIGGGPIGCELGQAFKLLGSKVTLLARSKILPKDDPELVSILRKKFIDDGITLYEDTKFNSINSKDNEISLEITTIDGDKTINGSHILIAAGRLASVEKLNLDKANIDYSKKGIIVNKSLRTSNKKVFAIGDVIGQQQFTHIASYHAGVIIKKILFHLPSKVDYKAIPWATYTTPELAHVGMNEREAKAYDKNYKVLSFDLKNNDRARTENATLGKIKVFASKRGNILGVSILADHASELLMPWSLVITKNLKLKDIASLIVSYPTLSEVNKFVASSFYKEMLFSPKMQRLVKFLNYFTF